MLRRNAAEHNIPRFPEDIRRKDWIKNWRLQCLWNIYLDVCIHDVDDDIIKYCTKNKLDYEIDGGWVYVLSDRRQYNDIINIINTLFEKIGVE